MDDADLVVVGAGFAGLAAAQAAAARGLRTIVLERKPDVGHQPNTTGILVKEVADLWDVPRRLTRKIHGVRLYSPSLKSIDLASPGYYFLATDTGALLRWWAEEAQRAGAQVRCASPYRGARREGARITLAQSTITTRYLLGADGVDSRVARDFALGCNRTWLAGMEAEFDGARGVADDLLHVFLDSKVAPGYIGWAVPGVGVTQVGLAATAGRRLDLDAFLARIGRVFDLSHARVVGHRAGRIPSGGPVRPMGCDGVLLAGDAAGLVSPLTAGGIHMAIDLGRQAGLAICDHLLDGGRDPHAVMRRCVPRFRFKRILRTALDLAPPPNWLLDAMLRTRSLRALAQTIFFHHRGLLSFEAWRAMAASMTFAR